MARQYFVNTLADSLIVPLSAVSPATSLTALLSATQANKYFPLPFGQSAPSPGSIFRFYMGGLVTTPASGTMIFTPFFGTGTGGVSLGASATLTPTASITSGQFRFIGTLVFRSISEVATTSTCWFQGEVQIAGPSGGTLVTVTWVFGSTAAVSVDTTGTAAAATFGALNLAVTPSVTASTFTPEIAYVEQLN